MSNKKRIHITEAQLKRLIDEDVFISSADTNTKKAKLKYAYKGGNYNKGNLNSNDMLKTDKMDELNKDTYEIPLKNGLMSYNITSINGTEVMHYFKRFFNHQTTNIEIEDENKTKKQYELEMEDREFRQFMYYFLLKVSAVVNYKVDEFQKQDKNLHFTNFAVYPVPSSSRFNKEMASRLQFTTVSGLTPRIIDSELLLKDFANVKIDDDFISKNKDYYASQVNDKFTNKTHIDYVNNVKNRFNSFQTLENSVKEINDVVTKLLTKWRNMDILTDNFTNNKTQKHVEQLNDLYQRYCKLSDKIKKQKVYYDDTIYDKTTKLHANGTIEKLKYSKGPSILRRSAAIKKLLSDFGYIKKDGRTKTTEIAYYQFNQPQIKNISNDGRMGLTNYFKVNDSEELVNQETNNANETLLLVFDDNISGGATLSDICYKLQTLGFKYIIPITFGKMATKYGLSNLTINAPTNDFNY